MRAPPAWVSQRWTEAGFRCERFLWEAGDKGGRREKQRAPVARCTSKPALTVGSLRAMDNGLSTPRRKWRTVERGALQSMGVAKRGT